MPVETEEMDENEKMDETEEIVASQNVGSIKKRKIERDIGYEHGLAKCREFGQDITASIASYVYELAKTASLRPNGRARACGSKSQYYLTEKEYMEIYKGIQSMLVNGKYVFRSKKNKVKIAHSTIIRDPQCLELFVKKMRREKFWNNFEKELNNLVSTKNLLDALSYFVESSYGMTTVDRGLKALKNKKQCLEKMKPILLEFIKLEGSIEEITYMVQDCFSKKKAKEEIPRTEEEIVDIVEGIIRNIKASKNLLRKGIARESLIDTMILDIDVGILELSERIDYLVDEEGYIING